MTDDLGPDADPFFEANEGWGADALEGTGWILAEMDEGPIALDPGPTLTVGAEGELAGSAGCNRWRAQAILGDGTISVGPLTLTRMLCPAPVMALETAFVAALEAVERWQRDGDVLEMSADEGRVRLVFRRAAPGSGEGADR